MTTVAETLSGKGHRDENFPVASWLMSAERRGPILAFYRFVRAADDGLYAAKRNGRNQWKVAPVRHDPAPDAATADL